MILLHVTSWHCHNRHLGSMVFIVYSYWLLLTNFLNWKNKMDWVANTGQWVATASPSGVFRIFTFECLHSLKAVQYKVKPCCALTPQRTTLWVTESQNEVIMQAIAAESKCACLNRFQGGVFLCLNSSALHHPVGALCQLLKYCERSCTRLPGEIPTYCVQPFL